VRGRAVRQASLVLAHNKANKRTSEQANKPTSQQPSPKKMYFFFFLPPLTRRRMRGLPDSRNAHPPGPSPFPGDVHSDSTERRAFLPRPGIRLVGDDGERAADPISYHISSKCFLRWNQPHTRQPAPLCPRVKGANKHDVFTCTHPGHFYCLNNLE
jgi:hypothetical protein